MASVSFQERYLIGGDEHEFVLDTEILEDVHSVKFALQRDPTSIPLTAIQAAALDKLFAYVESHFNAALAGATREERALRIRNSVIWHELRQLANEALRTFNVDVSNMTAEEVDALCGDERDCAP